MTLNKIARINLLDPTTVLGAIYYFLIFFLLAVLAARFLRLAVERIVAEDERDLIDPTVASFLTQLTQVGIYLVALILYAHLVPALRSLGTAVLASVSVASIVIGLAAQNTLGNLIAGVSLLLYRPFRLGDQVQVNAPGGPQAGTVEHLTLGYTILKAADERRIVVPNSTMASQITINLTAQRPATTAVVPLHIAYDADIDRARALLVELAGAHPQVEDVIDCPVTRLGDSSVELGLQVRCTDGAAVQQVQYDLYEQAKKRFDREGIEIPFPSTNVVLWQRGNHGSRGA